MDYRKTILIVAGITTVVGLGVVASGLIAQKHKAASLSYDGKMKIDLQIPPIPTNTDLLFPIEIPTGKPAVVTEEEVSVFLKTLPQSMQDEIYNIKKR